MKDIRKKMAKKGWDKKEVDDAIRRMSATEKITKHRQYYLHYAGLMYWTTLLVLLVSNFLVAIVLVPFLVVINTGFVYFIIGLLGLVFGILFNHLIRDIEQLERRHHFLAAIFIPVVAVLNLFAIVPVTNSVRIMLKVGELQNPLVIAAAYVCMFLLPYIWTSVKERV